MFDVDIMSLTASSKYETYNMRPNYGGRLHKLCIVFLLLLLFYHFVITFLFIYCVIGNVVSLCHHKLGWMG